MGAAACAAAPAEEDVFVVLVMLASPIQGETTAAFGKGQSMLVAPGAMVELLNIKPGRENDTRCLPGQTARKRQCPDVPGIVIFLLVSYGLFPAFS
ncbi:hypothetical protein [Alcanivorax quisquiliarum]|uniref:Uncharacterized protein n=1 Tax=Alcanivorax quisquiliarum TaxID=2933565 RepID=A0ABT0E363_9GAMM|nr:hypothetical protein [Alcanivorax quisquiliarum]MCK0536244.1 hypothetical protein [Alcanivorax quisquiliarum]